MTIPVYVVGAISLVTNCYISDRLNRRAIVLMWCCVPVITGYLICVGTSNAHASYAGMFILVLGVYPISTLVLYPSTQGPRYVQGNAVSAGLEVVAAALYFASWCILRRRNAQKKKLISEGATTNGLEGDRALDFKYGL
ncbi:hypothetical protein Sste5344_010518 [Sporothrix stenoceras]